MGMAQFLKSNHTSDLFHGSKSQKDSFGKYLKKYDNNELKPMAMKRQRKRKYVQVEEKMKKYLNLRSQKHKKDKCGISWILIREKCLGWATELGFHEFKVSAGWIQNTLKYYNLKRIKLQSKEKKLKGTKQIKDKTRVTIMVCTSASGSRLPLAVIGKHKNPTCFKLLNGNDTPLPYYNQNNAW